MLLLLLTILSGASCGPLTYYMSATDGEIIICRVSNFPSSGGSCVPCQLDGGGVAYVSLTASRAFGFSFGTVNCPPGDTINCAGSPMFSKTLGGTLYRYWLCNDDICPGSYAACPVGPTPTTTATVGTTTSAPKAPPPPPDSGGGSSVSVGAVIGGIIAAIAVLAVIVLFCCCCVTCCMKCRNAGKAQPSGGGGGKNPEEGKRPGGGDNYINAVDNAANNHRALGPPTDRCIQTMTALRKWMQDPADLEFLSRLTATGMAKRTRALTTADHEELLRQIDFEHESDGQNHEITYLTGNPTDLRQRINEFRSLYSARNWWTAIPDMSVTELRQHKAQLLPVNGGIRALDEARLLHEALDAHITWREQ